MIAGDRVRLAVAVGKEILAQWEQQEQEPLQIVLAYLCTMLGSLELESSPVAAWVGAVVAGAIWTHGDGFA